MSLSDYAGLVATVADWLDDATLTPVIPGFIALAEAEMNRRLRASGQEGRATATATGEYLPLPTDFGGMRTIHIEGAPDRPLEQMAAGEMSRMYASYSAANPMAYAVVAGQLKFAPVPASGVTVEMVYYRGTPALTATATTNWLLTAHPDAYLIGTLLQAEFRNWNDARLPPLKVRFDEIMEQIDVDARRKQWGASPIYPRPMPFQVRGARI